MGKEKRLIQVGGAVFFGAVLLGTIAANLIGRHSTDSFSVYLSQLQNAVNRVSFSKETYFFYLLRLRLMEAGAVWLLSMTSFGGVCLWAVILWLGFSGGVRISMATLVYGGRGILFFLASILPQIIFYIPAVLLLCGRGFGIYRFMKKQRDWGQYRRIRMTKDILMLLILILCILPGIICESYVSPLLLKLFFR